MATDRYYNGKIRAHEDLRRWDPGRHTAGCDCMCCETVKKLAPRIRRWERQQAGAGRPSS